MHLIEDLDGLNVRLEQETEVYLIEYHDVSYRDARLPGRLLYPKYRVFLVGERLFPAHRYVNVDNFNVHGRPSDALMDEYPWLHDEQEAFLSDPMGHIGEYHWEALRLSLIELGLDYVGCDFAPATQGDNKGDLVIFEANPAMRSRYLDEKGSEAMITAYAEVALSINQLIADKAGVAHWDFVLPPRSDDAENETGRYRFTVQGRVQGVGYRRWLRDRLNGFEASGSVRNRDDGTVEAVLQLPGEAVPEVKAIMARGPKRARVTQVDVEELSGAAAL